MIQRENRFVLIVLLNFISLTFLAIPGFALDQASTNANPSSQQTLQLIQELNAAKQADWNAALDPSVSPVRRNTFLNQMNKADRASKELSHGFAVPQSEIDDALWAPPKHISPELRAQLIRELKEARQQDDQNEQEMFWNRTGAPFYTAVFDQRKQQVDAVVKNLEIGVPVHWTAIRQALVVVPAPY